MLTDDIKPDMIGSMSYTHPNKQTVSLQRRLQQPFVGPLVNIRHGSVREEDDINESDEYLE